MKRDYYEIKLLSDILSVPAEHLDELLTDIRDYYELFQPLIAVGRPEVMLRFVPDGKRKHTIHIGVDFGKENSEVVNENRI